MSPLNKFLFILVLLFLPGHAAAQERYRLQIETSQAKTLFLVEIADSPGAWEQGLMKRETLAERHGMLFLFPETRNVQFWMKDTPLPLDLLFLDDCGRILRIAANAVPFSRERISSHAPVKAVLEIGGGIAQSLGVAAGDRVIHEMLSCP